MNENNEMKIIKALTKIFLRLLLTNRCDNNCVFCSKDFYQNKYNNSNIQDLAMPMDI